MAIEELRTSSAAMRVNSRAAVLAIAVAPVVRAELAELAAQGAREALEELAVQVVQEALAEPAAQVVREALEELAAQVAVAQVLVPAVEVLELAQAVEVPELVPVGAVRVLVRAAAELERGQVPGVAVRLRTRSVIAARRPGQVPLLAGAEDLAVVVVATMHAPAATEAATAWEAAE